MVDRSLPAAMVVTFVPCLKHSSTLSFDPCKYGQTCTHKYNTNTNTNPPTSHNDGHAATAIVFLPALPNGNPVGVVTQVHQRAHHHLVVDRDLRVFKVAWAGGDVLLHTYHVQDQSPVER